MSTSSAHRPPAQARDHVSDLEAQITVLEDDIKRLVQGQKIADADFHRQKIYFTYLVKKQEAVYNRGSDLRQELYRMPSPPPPLPPPFQTCQLTDDPTQMPSCPATSPASAA